MELITSHPLWVTDLHAHILALWEHRLPYSPLCPCQHSAWHIVSSLSCVYLQSRYKCVLIWARTWAWKSGNHVSSLFPFLHFSIHLCNMSDGTWWFFMPQSWCLMPPPSMNLPDCSRKPLKLPTFNLSLQTSGWRRMAFNLCVNLCLNQPC